MGIINAIIFIFQVIIILALLIAGLLLGSKTNAPICFFVFLGFLFFAGELGYLCHRSEDIQLNKDFIFFMAVSLLAGEIIGYCRKIMRI